MKTTEATTGLVVFELPDYSIGRWATALAAGTVVMSAASSKDFLPETLRAIMQIACLPFFLLFVVALFASQRMQITSHGVAVERRVFGILWRREQILRDEIQGLWLAWDQPEKKKGIYMDQRRFSRDARLLQHPVTLTLEHGDPLLVTATETYAEAQEIANYLSVLLARPVHDQKIDVVPVSPGSSRIWGLVQMGAYSLLVAIIFYLAVMILNREWWPFITALGAGFVLWITLCVRSWWMRRY